MTLYFRKYYPRCV